MNVACSTLHIAPIRGHAHIHTHRGPYRNAHTHSGTYLFCCCKRCGLLSGHFQIELLQELTQTLLLNSLSAHAAVPCRRCRGRCCCWAFNSAAAGVAAASTFYV